MFQINSQEIKALIQTALPLMAAFLAQKGMQFIDTLMMGWLGPEALAAGALSTTIFITVLVFCMGTLSAVGIYMARALGADQHHDISAHLGIGIWLAIFLSIPSMILIWHLPTVLLLLGQDPLVVHNAKLLLHGLVWGFPGFLLFFVFREFAAVFSLTRIVMLTALSCIPFTFCANYIFIYGKFGLPALGVVGIGYAPHKMAWNASKH